MIRPDTLRRLDRWVGVPLCFVATLMRRIGRLFGERDSTALAPRRILFIELAEMGSVVLASPALHRVRALHGATPLFLIFAHNRGSLALTGALGEDDVFVLRAEGLFPLLADCLRFLLWTRRKGVDAVVDLEIFSRFTAVLAWLTGARIRAGFQRAGDEGAYRGDLFSRPVRYDPDRHMAENFLALADAAFPSPFVASAAIDIPRRAVSGEEVLRAQERLKSRVPAFDARRHRVVLVNPNVGDLLPQRRWAPERYAQLIRAVLDRYPDVFVFLIGAASDREAVAALEQEVASERCAGIAGAFAVPELPGLFECSKLLVTSDSGPAHFAAVADLPVVVLFGPETPRRYAPLGPAVVLYAALPCSPCVSVANQRRSRCTDNRCMQAIGVAAVFREVRKLLEPGAAAARAGASERLSRRA